MLAQVFAFLGSLFYLIIDTIYKIGLTLVLLFLVVIAIATGFAAGIVALLH